jgi:3-phenylpropionate/trans-cinnamate dioxygenase ferredoxin reductase subunit
VVVILPEATDVLLVGGGVASVRCARTLRREGFDGSITLVGDEATPPYNRPPLSKELLRDDLPDELVLAEPTRWYERRNVSLVLGRRVAGLDPDAREAVLDDGGRIRFARCLLATGAAPRALSVPSGEQAILLRTLADARRLRAAATSAGPGAAVTVIGGSFIGIEVASSLAALGLKPAIVEIGERLWSGRLGMELAAWAADRLADAGIEVRLGVGVDRLEGGATWTGGERHDAAFVTAGVGVLPRDDLGRAAGLEVGDGVVVDAEQRTSHPAIWAAGDVARHTSVRIEHWHSAREGGERAAHSMLGLPALPALEPWFFSEVGGASLDVIGLAVEWDEERWITDRLLAYLVAGRLVQLASIGSAMSAEQMRELVAARAPIETVSKTSRTG